jgi:hypothetical protein
VPSGRERTLFSDLCWAGFLTTGQIERLAFPSRRRTQRRLRALLDHGYLRAHLQGGALHRDTVWTLGPRGLVLLRDEGLVAEKARPYRLNPRSQKLGHAVAVRNVAVSFLTARAQGLLAVTDIRLDGELANRSPFREARLVPDVLVTIDDGGIARVVMCEVNCASQPLAQVRQKLLAYVRARATGAPLFSAPGLVVLVASEGERRMANIREFASGLGPGQDFRTCVLDKIWYQGNLVQVLGPFSPIFRPAR